MFLSDLPEAAPGGRRNVGMGKAVFPSMPLRCHLLGEAQHICSCWPPTSTPLPFLSTAARKMISCDTESNKRRTCLFLLLYPRWWPVSLLQWTRPSLQELKLHYFHRLRFSVTLQEGLRISIGKDSHPSKQGNDKTTEFPPRSQEVLHNSSWWPQLSSVSHNE